MAFDDGRSADLFGESALLTRLDLTDEENAKDAAHQLERCRDDFQLAAWARRWGRPLTEAIRNGGAVDQDALEEATEAANKAEAQLADLKKVAEGALAEFDNMAADLPDEVVNRLNDIFAKLDNAL